jgi:hypothetical protein
MLKEEVKQQIKLIMHNNGSIEFEGQMNEDVQELINTALQNAEYYKQKTIELEKKTVELEQQKLQKICEIDFINVVFVGSVITMTFFLFTQMVSIGLDSFRPQPQEISNVRQ